MEDFFQNQDVSLFKNSFTYAAIGMALVALTGQFLTINRAFSKMVGYSQEELLHMSFQDITYQDDLSNDLQHLQQLTQHIIESYQIEKRYVHKSGYIVWVLLNVSMVQNEHHEPEFYIAQIQDITDRKQVESELKNERDKFSSIINSHADAISILQPDGRTIQVNPAYEQIFGWQSEELENTIPSPIPMTLQDEAYTILKRVQSGENVVSWETDRLKKDETLINVSITLSPIRDESDKITMIVGITRDITEQKKSEQKARLAAQVLESITEGIIVTDKDSNIISVNAAFTDITGYDAHEVLNQKPSILSYGHDNKKIYIEMWNSIKKYGKWHGELINKRKDGTPFVEELSINSVKDDHGQLINYVGIIKDITKRKSLEKKIHYQAYHDPLTGLANRRLFQENLMQSIKLAKSSKCKVAVLFLDLDRFKMINDVLGHHQGDQLLIMVAERLVRCVGENNIVSRLGGDEFNILITHIDDSIEAAKIAEQILDSLAKPFILEGSEYFIFASIGISIYPENGDSESILIQNADMAMYSAKRERANFKFHTPATIKESKERLMLQNDLRKALNNKEFIVYYQPKVDLSMEKICGVEALVRWRNPTLGMVSPDMFIPIAEEMGFIIPLGESILRTACKQNKMWQVKGFPPIRVSVNISFLQIQQANFVNMIHQVLHEEQLEPRYLELELTESIIMKDSEKTISILQELKNIGVQISLDDFGSGYSSLNYLKKLPINTLKIDRSFMKDIGERSLEREIVRVIIDLAHILHLRVTTEGVETIEQLHLLQEYQSDEIQGFLFCQPVTGDHIERLLSKN